MGQEGRTVHSLVEPGDASMITVRVPGHITGWSWNTPIPSTPRDDCNCHFILFVHGGVDEKYMNLEDPVVYAPLRKNRQMKFSVTDADLIEVHAFYFDKKKLVQDWQRGDSDITRSMLPFLSDASIENDHTL